MIQIDIKMPKCCDECFALDDHGDYPFCLISQDQRGYNFNTREKRMPTCPLKAQEHEALDMPKPDVINNINVLMKCPFCGSAAKMLRDGISSYKIFCTSIYCDAQMGWCSDDDLLADEWNRRVNDG